MLKYVLLAALVGSAYAGGISQEDELYVVAGILGGICLLLTIASIYTTVSLISLQAKVAVLQHAGSAVTKVVSETPGTQQMTRDDTPPRDPYAELEREEVSRFSRQERPDNFRRQPRRDNFRMERPAPPPRPVIRQESRSNAGYY